MNSSKIHIKNKIWIPKEEDMNHKLIKKIIWAIKVHQQALEILIININSKFQLQVLALNLKALKKII